MKPEKSFEYFSAYYEGTLDPVLKDQFEKLIATDPSVSEQFASFVDSIESLAVLAEIRPVAPTDLHEIIMRRVDHNAFELKKSQSRFSFANLKIAWFGAAAALALIAAVVALRPSNSSAYGAGFSPNEAVKQGQPLQVAMENGSVIISVVSANAEKVRVTNLDDSKLIKEYTLKANQPLNSPILNDQQLGALLKIEAVTSKEEILVAIPSRIAEQKSSGEGTLLEMAKAFSNYYQKPVEIRFADATKNIRWKFVSHDPMSASFEVGVVKIELKEGLYRLRD